MRVCLILEGCYPYVRGGVSTWAQEYMKSNPTIEFVVWTIHSDRKNAQNPQYELPQNVIEMREIFLEDAYLPSKRCKYDRTECVDVIEKLSHILYEAAISWDDIIEHCRASKITSSMLGNSEEFLDFAVQVAKNSKSKIGLSDAFYGLKSMILPLYFLLQQEIPEADLYHSAVTGYGGILGSIAKKVTKKPFVLTEHGIYPREREEELLQADWVVSSLRSTWIDMFYNLSKCAYYYADRVTSLFNNASQKQIEIGCDPEKCTIVANGIHYENFSSIKAKENSECINIGAFIRFAPIKDIKTLIYAFYELNKKIQNVNLYILGGTDDQNYKEECLSLIERLGMKNIFVEGHIDTVEYMGKMDFTVMSSISEGQPLAILESLASARPCITTNVGNCNALLEQPEDDYGQAGFCCSPMDSVGIARFMEILCTNKTLRCEFGENGRERVKNNYTHEIMKNKYLEVYREVM